MSPGVRHVDLAELALEAAGIGLEPGEVGGEHALERGPHVGHAEHRVGGDLVEADPQAEVVAGEAPLLAELVEVGA